MAPDQRGEVGDIVFAGIGQGLKRSRQGVDGAIDRVIAGQRMFICLRDPADLAVDRRYGEWRFLQREAFHEFEQRRRKTAAFAVVGALPPGQPR